MAVLDAVNNFSGGAVIGADSSLEYSGGGEYLLAELLTTQCPLTNEDGLIVRCLVFLVKRLLLIKRVCVAKKLFF